VSTRNLLSQAGPDAAQRGIVPVSFHERRPLLKDENEQKNRPRATLEAGQFVRNIFA